MGSSGSRPTEVLGGAGVGKGKRGQGPAHQTFLPLALGHLGVLGMVAASGLPGT